jgi:hypothetical protein
MPTKKPIRGKAPTHAPSDAGKRAGAKRAGSHAVEFRDLDDREMRALACLEAALARALDWIEYLDERDRPPFDEHWSAAFERIERAKAELSKSRQNSLKARSTIARERAFKLVVKVTGNSDLASYVSDDFGLIFDARGLDLADPWIQALLDEYLAGRLPRGR